ncbi:hypothetical protein [Vulcanisaeta thermophila]|uniref:hypothetical protein n=1 Tax=Vulcanisaeta thermophila TaxID=867917 RepID=UPI0009FFB25A|nr:hypothetical protein [Vulcanisaeta thermophila]
MGKALDLGGEAFIGLKAGEEVLREIDGKIKGIRVKSDVENGAYYSSIKNDTLIGDELRMNLENRAVEAVSKESLGSSVLVIDGPLYLGIGFSEVFDRKRI